MAKERNLVCYDDIDMRQTYNHGFWHGVVLTIVGITAIVGLTFMCLIY